MCTAVRRTAINNHTESTHRGNATVCQYWFAISMSWHDSIRSKRAIAQTQHCSGAPIDLQLLKINLCQVVLHEPYAAYVAASHHSTSDIFTWKLGAKLLNSGCCLISFTASKAFSLGSPTSRPRCAACCSLPTNTSAICGSRRPKSSLSSSCGMYCSAYLSSWCLSMTL